MLPAATISEYDGVRSLHLGTPWIQGSMRIAKPLYVELDYVQRMLASLLWLPTEALGHGPAVQLGLGAGAITRFTHKVLKVPTTAVELNPQVILACRALFRLGPDGAGLTVIQHDAGAWVRQAAQAGSVQLLHVDLYDHEAAAPVLDDEAFYRRCQALLAPGGLMAVNLFGRDASFERSARRIAAAFGQDQVWSLQATREGNTVVVAGRGVVVPGRDVLQARAEHLEAQFGKHGLQARKWLRMVRPYRPAALA
jgi:spermidine synthase